MATTVKNVFEKDPVAVLDYKFDWANTSNGGTTKDWLASGETISSRVVQVEAGLTKDSDSLTDGSTSVTVWLSGGQEGKDYHVFCKIVTSLNRTDRRRIKIQVRNRPVEF